MKICTVFTLALAWLTLASCDKQSQENATTNAPHGSTATGSNNAAERQKEHTPSAIPPGTTGLPPTNPHAGGTGTTQ